MSGLSFEFCFGRQKLYLTIRSISNFGQGIAQAA